MQSPLFAKLFHKSFSRLKYLIAPPENKTNDATSDLKLGNAFLANGDLTNASECYRQAMLKYPDNADAYINLGFILNEQSSYEQAAGVLQQATLLQPNSADAHYLLGISVQQLGKSAQAILHYKKAIAIKPDFEEAYYNLCNASFTRMEFEPIRPYIEKALALNPDRAEFHFFAGNLEYFSEQFDKAIHHFRHATQLRADFYDAFKNLGKVCLQTGNIDEAFRAYSSALTINPNSIDAESCLLFIQAYHSAPPPSDYLARAQQFGDHVDKLAKPYTNWHADNFISNFQPLRIGVVSGDLNLHPVAFFLERILGQLNRDKLQLYAYPTSPLEDQLSAKLKPHFVAWKPIVGLSDESAAKQIYADKIHILIDLSGHTLHNRLSLFAWKPAPIQVSWLGYLASTGVKQIDYLLADPITVPESNQDHFTETIWYLPSTVNCLTPPPYSDELPLTSPPVVSNGYISFGCFQNLSKLTDHTLEVWSQILCSLPTARLRLQMKQLKSKDSQNALLLRLAKVGIDTQRVQLEGYVGSRLDYFAKHQLVDIILDTFPCPGITTTCEALWMGVPTVTLAGNTLLTRQGASLLSCVGLTDWVARNEQEYIALAISHAQAITQLTEIRATLRPKAIASPLFNAALFSNNLELAFSAMWQKYCSEST